MNLVRDPWIRCLRPGPSYPWISPLDLAEPAQSLSMPRPEFDAAVIQFLVGLVQTSVVLVDSPLAAGDAEAWTRLWQSPPSRSDLEQALLPLAGAFDLLGDGPRFLQDLELEGEPLGIEQILLESPGANSIKLGKDHFVQNGLVQQLCPPCSAAALLSHQLNASSGGVGYRVGLRGGGPLTTLIKVRDSLWRTVWANVLPSDEFLESFKPRVAREADLDPKVFPWVAPTSTSEKGRPATLPSDVHPLQMYWAMPRRVRLVAEEENEQCSLCGTSTETPVTGYAATNYGVNYGGEFQHPLSPHWTKKEKGRNLLLPVHTGRDATYYDDLLGYLFEDSEELATKAPASGRIPAKVVSCNSSLVVDPDERAVLWVCGFAMDKAKVETWTEGTLPVIAPTEPEKRQALEDQVRRMVHGARRVEFYLVRSVKAVLKRRPKDAGNELTDLRDAFWRRTESAFHRAWRRVREVLDDEAAVISAKRQWLSDLRSAAEELFRERASLRQMLAVDPKRVSDAENELSRNLSSKALRELLGLPVKSRKREEAA